MSKRVAGVLIVALVACTAAAPTEEPGPALRGIQPAVGAPGDPGALPPYPRHLFRAMLKDGDDKLRAVVDLQVVVGEPGSHIAEIIAALRVLGLPGVRKLDIMAGPSLILSVYDGDPFAASYGLLFRKRFSETDLASGLNALDLVNLARSGVTLANLATSLDGPSGDFLTIQGHIR